MEIELGDKRENMKQRPSGSGTAKGKGKKRLKEGERGRDKEAEGLLLVSTLKETERW